MDRLSGDTSPRSRKTNVSEHPWAGTVQSAWKLNPPDQPKQMKKPHSAEECGLFAG